MAKKRSAKSTSRKSSTRKTRSRDGQRPAKKPMVPKQRSCDLDGKPGDEGVPETMKEHQDRVAADRDRSGRNSASDHGRIPWLLLGAILLAVVSLVLPWEGTWFGALAIHPTRYAPWLDSPAMLGALVLLGLAMLPAAAMALWQHWGDGRSVSTDNGLGRTAAEWTLGATAMAGLAVTAYYNESLNLSPLAGIRDQLWGIPLLVPAALAGGTLLAWKTERATAGNLAHLLIWSCAVILVSALVPVYEFGERHIPVAAALLRLGKGGAQSAAGFSTLLLWSCAAAGLWLGLHSFAKRRDAAAKESRSKRKSRGKMARKKLSRPNGPSTDPKRSDPARQAMAQRLAPVLGWAILLAAPLTALAAAISSQTGRQWFLGMVPDGADSRHHLAGLTGLALAGLTTAWSLALAWTAPRLAAFLLPGTVDRSAERSDTKVLFTESFQRVLFWSAAALMGMVFLVLELQAVGFTVTDENIYYYQAMLVAQGKIPYRDFFFAHPPLHILIPAILFRLFGFHLLLAKAISITSGLGAGFMVLLTGRRIGGNLVGLAAAGLYLFAFAILNAAINLTGMNLTVFFLMAGVYLVVSQRPGWAGLAVGAAMSTGFYSAAAAAALLAAAFLRSRPFGVRFALGLFGMWGGINLLFWAMGGSAFLDGVYRYHGKKMPQDPRFVFYSDSPVKALFSNLYVLLTGKEFKKTMFYHAHLLVPWAVAAVAWIAIRMKKLPESWTKVPQKSPAPGLASHLLAHLRGSSNRSEPDSAQAAPGSSPAGDEKRAAPTRGLARKLSALGTALWSHAGLAVVWLVALALVVEFSMFRRLYSFYFVLWYPFMALAAAWLLVSLLKGLAKAKTASVVFLSAGLLWAASLHPALANWGGSLHKGELRRKGRRIDYPWRKAGALTAATPLVKALFWRGYRLRAEPAESIHQFLWNKKRHFDEAPEIARYIQDNTAADQTIAGASAVAPLLAILAHRHIAAEIVDTNTNRFKAGLITEEEFYRRICQTKLAYLVSSPMSFFSWRKMRFHSRFLERFTLDRTFLARSVRFRGVFPVRLLKNEYGAAKPPYCRFLGTSRLPRPLRRRKRKPR